MNKFFIYAGLVATLPLALVSCTDQEYDLDNLDKTSDIRVDNLTLPIKIDPITLKEILNPDIDSPLKSVNIDGKEFYAVTQEGKFESQSIEIPTFGVNTPDIAPSMAHFDIFTPLTANKKALSPLSFDYQLRSFSKQTVEIKSSGVDESLKSLSSVTFKPANLKVTLTTTNIPNFAEISFPSLNLQILKGFKFINMPSDYSYDETSGNLTISNLNTVNNKAVISLDLVGIDFKDYPPVINGSNFNLSGVVDFGGGTLNVVIDPTKITPDFTPDNSIDISVKTEIDDFVVESIAGEVKYTLTGDDLNIAPVSLGDIPAFLNQEGTNIELANPQIYINLNNPLAADKLYYQTGIEFTAVRQDGRESFTPDNNKVIATRPDFAGPYNFLLSPSTEGITPPPAYAQNLEPIGFSKLSKILSGNGLPESIEINLISPGLPLQYTPEFKLGESNKIDGIVGYYYFLAPIALNDGSVIIYSDTEDGWNDDTLNDLNIELLRVTADVTTTLPIGAELVAYPINTKGEKIAASKAELNLPAGADKKQIDITMRGPIENLDGITFTAIVKPGNQNPLSPTQTITLSNLKVTVSGHYEFSLGDDDNEDNK